MNKEEMIGKRFIDIMTKLEDLGVFYGKNYDGEYHEKYPHSCNWFSISLDQHRSGFSSEIVDGCGDNNEEIAIGEGENAVEQEGTEDKICRFLYLKGLMRTQTYDFYKFDDIYNEMCKLREEIGRL